MSESTKSNFQPEDEPKDSIEIGNLVNFDIEYFEDIKSRDKELRRTNMNDPKYRYFTVLSINGEKLGIIGIYDADGDTNLTDTIVDPAFRGRGLAQKFKDALMEKLDLPFVTLTVDYDKNMPTNPTRNNLSSLRAVAKLPGVERIYDPRYEKIQKAKFIYRRRKSIENSLSGDKMATVKRIKQQIDNGELEGKDWGAIRRGFGIPLRKTIKDTRLMLDMLGPDTLMKYFRALSGANNPYRFVLPLSASNLPEYMTYEFGGAPAYLIADLLKKPLSPAGVNIFISHCIFVPGFTYAIAVQNPIKDLDGVIKRILIDYPETESIIKKIFDTKRISYIAEIDKCRKEDNPIPLGLVREFKNYEQALFSTSRA